MNRNVCLLAIASIAAWLPEFVGAVEYHPTGTVLTLDRENFHFELDDYSTIHLEGEEVASVWSIYGSEATYWLGCGDTFREYDLEGHLLRTIPSLPAETERAELRLGVREDFLFTKDVLFRVSKPRNIDAWFVSVYDFKTLQWTHQGPLRLGTALDRYDDDGRRRLVPIQTRYLAVKDQWLTLIHPLGGSEVKLCPLGREGREFYVPDSTSVGPNTTFLNDHKGVFPEAKNARGSWIRHRRTDLGSGPLFRSADAFTEYDVLDESGATIGWLRRQDFSTEATIESPAEPCWALLGDGTVLEVRTLVRREPDDAVTVVRWSR